MKTKKWFVVVFLLIGTTAFAQVESDFTVTLTGDNAGVVITGYNGSTATVMIPMTIQGMPVREIGASAFTRNTTVTRVVIPEGVTEIRSVDGSRDGRNGGGFWTAGAFAGCSNLVSVTLPLSLTTIGRRSFAACTALTSIIIPEGVITIGDEAFAGCRLLVSVTLPNTLTRLGRSAFSTEFEILGASAGRSSMPIFTSIILPESLAIIEAHTFSGVRTLTSIVIPEGITEMRDSAFDGCIGLMSVTLPSTITSIGNNIFRGCAALATVIIPDSVETIRFNSNRGNDSFSGNEKLNLASQSALRRRGYTGSF